MLEDRGVVDPYHTAQGDVVENECESPSAANYRWINNLLLMSVCQNSGIFWFRFNKEICFQPTKQPTGHCHNPLFIIFVLFFLSFSVCPFFATPPFKYPVTGTLPQTIFDTILHTLLPCSPLKPCTILSDFPAPFCENIALPSCTICVSPLAPWLAPISSVRGFFRFLFICLPRAAMLPLVVRLIQSCARFDHLLRFALLYFLVRTLFRLRS